MSLLAFVGVVDGERVEVMGAAHLELDGTLGPLDPHRPRVLAPRRQQEVLHLVDLLRLPNTQAKQRTGQDSRRRPTINAQDGRGRKHRYHGAASGGRLC